MNHKSLHRQNINYRPDSLNGLINMNADTINKAIPVKQIPPQNISPSFLTDGFR